LLILFTMGEVVDLPAYSAQEEEEGEVQGSSAVDAMPMQVGLMKTYTRDRGQD
jgi:hypothetical protein